MSRPTSVPSATIRTRSGSSLTRGGWLRALGAFLGLRRVPMNRLEAAFLAVGLLTAVAAFLQSAKDVFTYGGIDLRPRVVGARCLWEGVDPYTFEWEPGYSDRLLDPSKHHPGPSRVTYPPTTLLFYSSLAWLPYPVQRPLWALLEWLAMAGSLALLARLVSRPRRLLFVGLALLFFVGSSFWRLHVERGQYYVFLLFFLSAGAWLARTRPNGAGVLFGLAVALRPTLVLLPIILGACRHWRLALVSGATAVLLGLVTLPFGGLALWRSAEALTAKWWEVVIDEEAAIQRLPPEEPVPSEAEGVELRSSLPDRSGNITLAGAYGSCTQAPPGVLSLQQIAQICALVLLVAAPFLAWACGRGELGWACAYGVTASLALDFFLPYRIGYTDVLFLLPLALLTRELFREKQPDMAAALLLFGLAAGQVALFGPAKAAWLRYLPVMAALAFALGKASRLGTGHPPVPAAAKQPEPICPGGSP